MRNVSADTIIIIKRCVEEYFDTYMRSPSVREIATITNISKSTVQRYLDIMERVGIIFRGDYGIETDYISKTEKEMVSVAKIGRIPCGPLDEKEEYIEGYVKLPASFVGKGKFYILTASGESMIEAGIDDGDMVIIKKQEFAKPGDIVVALANGQNTLKRYFPEPSMKKIRLHPENSEMEDIFVDECQIQGIATKVIKSL
ncbi:MAG: repressor LexA [Clostridia bacterium]|nr:repressor LexA [Clostridia bacterium]MBO5092036.1 repressor LexA [Clostridia bacterium]MBP3494648.1 repressor LexA [Clostridia bacterium]MBQ7788547.1 repressor LexA [Clostridia bacterium]